MFGSARTLRGSHQHGIAARTHSAKSFASVAAAAPNYTKSRLPVLSRCCFFRGTASSLTLNRSRNSSGGGSDSKPTASDDSISVPACLYCNTEQQGKTDLGNSADAVNI
jgi:hypothetical protein